MTGDKDINYITNLRAPRVLDSGLPHFSELSFASVLLDVVLKIFLLLPPSKNNH